MLASASAARATSIEATVTTFAGSDSAVDIALIQDGNDIVVTVDLAKGHGDIRGIFFNLVGDEIPTGLRATGHYVTDVQTGDVIDLGQGNNLHGDGSPCPCDIGIALGTPGSGKDDIESTSFVLRADQPLSLDEFANQLVGVRVTSVSGFDDSGKDGSSHWGHTFGWKWADDSKDKWSSGSSDHDKKSSWNHDKKSGGDDSKGKGDSDYASNWKDRLHCDDSNDDGDGEGSAKLVGQFPDLVPVPEPASAWLLAIGLGAFGWTRRARR